MNEEKGGGREVGKREEGAGPEQAGARKLRGAGKRKTSRRNRALPPHIRDFALESMVRIKSMPALNQFFDELWKGYIQIAPGAERLHKAVEARGEKIVNDHIAFRTFDLSPINLESLERHVLALGYKRFEPYAFEDKKLKAWGYMHPGEYRPRIFLSELETKKFSPSLQKIVKGLCAQVDPGRVASPDVLWSGRLWQPVAYETYQALLEESEYAAWVAAMGLRANHFTISVNALKTFKSLEDLLDFIEGQGFALNVSGGRIKGSPKVLLEQGSTLADRVEVEFAGGVKKLIPSCYYEFARRYPGPDGKLYQGFVAASADKIFESTNVKRG